MAKRTLNPLIYRYISTDIDLSALTKETPDSSSPILSALGLLDDFVAGRRSDNVALRAAGDVIVEGTDPDLLVLFFSKWAIAALMKGRTTESRTLLHQARAITTRTTPPEVSSYADIADAHLCASQGNRSRQKELLLSALSRVSASSPRRKHMLVGAAHLLAQLGQLEDIETDLLRFDSQSSSDSTDPRITALRFINSVETGRIAAARDLIAHIDENRTPPPITRDISKYKLILNFMDPDSLSPDIDTGDNVARDMPDWALVIHCLLTNRSNQALRWSRLREKRIQDSIMGHDLVSFNLVRAELSDGNADAARRILKMRRQQGNKSYLDDFFLARAELISRHLMSARDLFSAAVKAVESYKAVGRLNFELRLSPEIPRDMLFELARATHDSTRVPTATTSRSLEMLRETPESHLDGIVGMSQSTRAVRETILKFAPSDIPVLITGETGTGKELVASAIHTTGPRAAEPFVAINCGAIAESLLESELFGHEKGAFSGAGAAHKGLFEEAGKGTILLDEIGDISPRLQIVLLRVLETGEIRPVGSARPRLLTCRVLMSTNANLDERARDNSFRKDLLYRLRRLEIHLHPLRERAQDILPLTTYFLDIGRSDGIHAIMSQRLIETLMTHSWPGNVRELRNAVERMRLMNSDKLYYDHEDIDIHIGSIDASAPQEAARPALNDDNPVTLLSPPIEDTSLLQRERTEIGLSIRKGTSRVRRLALLRNLFRQHQLLTRGEIIDTLLISPNTATKDLKELRDEGFIRKMQPTSSPRSAYFVLDGDR